MPTNVVLVDDHVMFRTALRALLAGEPDVAVVGEAFDSHSTYALVEQHRPDLLILDVRLPGASGLTVGRELRSRRPELKLLFVSGVTDSAVVAEAWRQGAAGYVAKNASSSAFLAAVRAVAGGARWWPELDYTDKALVARTAADPLGPLSPREREVFALVVRGESNEGAGSALGISARTIETHRANMMRKLGTSTLAELFRYAARHGQLER